MDQSIAALRGRASRLEPLHRNAQNELLALRRTMQDAEAHHEQSTRHLQISAAINAVAVSGGLVVRRIHAVLPTAATTGAGMINDAVHGHDPGPSAASGLAGITESTGVLKTRGELSSAIALIDLHSTFNKWTESCQRLEALVATSDFKLTALTKLTERVVELQAQIKDLAAHQDNILRQQRLIDAGAEERLHYTDTIHTSEEVCSTPKQYGDVVMR